MFLVVRTGVQRDGNVFTTDELAKGSVSSVVGMQHSTVTSALLETSHLDKAISMTRPSQSEAKFIKVEICDMRTLN